MLDVSPHALTVPDIDTTIGLAHTLFALEDRYGLVIYTPEGGIPCLRVDERKAESAHALQNILFAWQKVAALLESGEITKEEYDRWRYQYPEFARVRLCLKPSSRKFKDDWLMRLKGER